jgi:hypothetical protein
VQEYFTIFLNILFEKKKRVFSRSRSVIGNRATDKGGGGYLANLAATDQSTSPEGTALGIKERPPTVA